MLSVSSLKFRLHVFYYSAVYFGGMSRLSYHFLWYFRYTKKKSELDEARVKIQELEATLSSKEVALTAALGEKRSLEEEAENLKAQVVEVRRNI